MNKYLNVFLLGTALSASAACASPSPIQVEEKAPPSPQAREFSLEFADEFTRTKLRKNGEYLFCDQTGYLDCFKVTREQCLQELAPLKDDCMERSEKKFPDQLTNAKEIDRFAAYFSVCMMLKHGMEKDANELGACLKKVQWDKVQRNKSLLQ